MNGRAVAVVAGLILILTLSPTSQAQLLNPPITNPAITYNSTGQLSYDAAAKTLKVTATALLFSDGGLHFIQPFFTGTVTLTASVDNSGNLIAGTPVDLVVTGNIDIDNDSIFDYTGTLLTAKVTAFGYQDSGTNTDNFDFLLDVTGGSLAGVMPWQIGLIVTSEHSPFVGSFQTSFTGGGAKGTIGSLFGDGCTRTPGYWKTHACVGGNGKKCAWPVDSLSIGGVIYDAQELLNLLSNLEPDGSKALSDASARLAKFLIAAKFSILSGATPAGIEQTILDGDALLAVIGVGSNPTGQDAADANALADLLDAYVNAYDCDDSSDSGGGNLGGCNQQGGSDWDLSQLFRDWGDKGDYGDRNKGGKHDDNKSSSSFGGNSSGGKKGGSSKGGR